ncbi:DUF4184 family protein [Brevibacillus brevis]|uniref:DUF4184 family protein n=1 Tax=Brevibacillus brevis TaxID=1393 RepID=A0ABY9SZI8_BREBE|nr:DUF4184 family protein [Brevibacillus brevis]WNC12441.1 DUF4184 family protein [Brevibacillus brevis]
MPFTFAHPAIVLPLRKSRFFFFPALALGSMAPDFEYFFRMQPYSVYSHTIAGIFWFDLPLVACLWLLFHAIVQEPLIACLPEAVGRRIGPVFRTAAFGPSWRWVLIFVYSALLGIGSHIVWDAFTHKGGYAVLQLPVLEHQIGFGAWVWPVYKWLQHGSSCIGFAAIALVLWKAGRKRGAFPRERRLPVWIKWMFWGGSWLVGVIVAGLHVSGKNADLTLPHLLSGVVPFLSGCMLGVLLFSWATGRFVLKK